MNDQLKLERKPPASTGAARQMPKRAAAFPAPATEPINGNGIEAVKTAFRELMKTSPDGEDRRKKITEVAALAGQLVGKLDLNGLNELKTPFIANPDDDKKVREMCAGIIISINEKETELRAQSGARRTGF
ncbi:hypothetical protein H0O00_03730 [Candidatus Micrarchaeota archaeon]|nr:hypothetical protein [Candidatus Micrarchaeota archaeon]